MQKTNADHTKFREAMTKAAQKAAYPTKEMINQVDSELRSFRFTYLPFGEGLLSPENKDKLTIDELDLVVSETLSHLKQDLIPKLKQMQSTVQKRNIWLECEKRNDYHNAVFESESNRVHQLIVEDEEKLRLAKEDAAEYPKVIEKALALRHREYDIEVLSKLTEL